MAVDATILVTGAAGFIGGYLVEELLRRGCRVVGVDNYSKYGRVSRSFDNHPQYTFAEVDATRGGKSETSPTSDYRKPNKK